MDVHWLQILSQELMCWNAALLLWIFNGQSEDIKKSINDIQEILSNLEVSNGIIQIYGKYHAEDYARTVIINKMEKFQGFEASGFVTLGKPLLSSMFGNFITYLIILMQFKISES